MLKDFFKIFQGSFYFPLTLFQRVNFKSLKGYFNFAERFFKSFKGLFPLTLFQRVRMEELFTNKILFLAGIHFDQIITVEEQLDKCMRDMINNTVGDDITEDIIVFDKIPSEYTNKTWPEQTNLKCWQCDRFFSTRPIFIAIQSWIDRDEGLKMIVDKDLGGNFCSGDCAYTTIMKDYPQTARQGRKTMLMQLLKDMFPDQQHILQEIVPKTRRKEYGGDL